MKCSHELLKLKILLFAGVLLVTVGKQAKGLECYCQRGIQIHSTGCSEDKTCTGDVCFIKRKKSFGSITNHWGCINISINPSWQDTCQRNDLNIVYDCCMDSNDCNRNLTIYLPHEVPPPKPSTTVQPFATSSQVSPSSSVVVSHPTTSFNVEPVTTPPPVSRSPSSAPAPTCYCNETASTPSESCINQGYSCDAHSKCYTRRYYDEGRGEIHMQWACLSPQMPSNVCSGGMNNEKNVYECCNGSNWCNRYLKLVLPMEEEATTIDLTATPASAIPGGSAGGIDLYIIMSIVIASVVMVLGTIFIAVLVYICLRQQRLQAKAAAMSLQKRTSKRHLQLNVGVIVNEVGHSYASVPAKTKSLNGLIA